MGFKDVFKAAFPFISAAAALGGPLGTMAANAVGKAIGADNVSPDQIPDVIAAATAKDPDAMLKLKQAEDDFQLQMQKLGFDSAAKIADIDAQDRANARSREIAVRDKIPAVLAIAVTLGFFSLLWLLAFHDIPKEAHDILMTMVGVLGSAWMGIVTYYFGSSAGQDRQAQVIGHTQK